MIRNTGIAAGQPLNFCETNPVVVAIDIVWNKLCLIVSLEESYSALILRNIKTTIAVITKISA